jgi:hypothetical protein
MRRAGQILAWTVVALVALVLTAWSALIAWWWGNVLIRGVVEGVMQHWPWVLAGVIVFTVVTWLRMVNDRPRID